MRASDLIGQEVYDAAAKRVGVVTDLRCVQDGPLRGSMQAPRIAALIISARHTGSLLGYDRRSQQGPWLIRIIIRFLHRHALLVPWEDVADSTGPILLNSHEAGRQPLDRD
jgi:hypothetical protein